MFDNFVDQTKTNILFDKIFNHFFSVNFIFDDVFQSFISQPIPIQNFHNILFKIIFRKLWAEAWHTRSGDYAGLPYI